jgi:hypothetical protein
VVWLDVPFEETARRMAVRDGLVLDNSDVDRPRLAATHGVTS